MAAKPLKLTPPKPFIPKEFDEQCAVFDYAEYAAKHDPRWSLLFATLNGLRLTIGQARKAKRAGMRRGVLDIWLPVITRHPDGNIRYVGAVCDLKRIKGGVEDPYQDWWIEQLREQMWKTGYCKGAKVAIQFFESYLAEGE